MVEAVISVILIVSGFAVTFLFHLKIAEQLDT